MSAKRQKQTPSETRLGLHPARGDGGLERREVPLVLVGVRLGERGHRPVEVHPTCRGTR